MSIDVKKILHDAGPNFSLADVFLFAQIPSRLAAIPATAIAAYVFFRSTATGATSEFLKKIESPIGSLFLRLQPSIPLLNNIAADEFDKDKKGAATLMVGMAQLPVFIGSLLTVAKNPTVAIGWLAALATGCFAAGNILVGLHLNEPMRVKAEKEWLDVLASPAFLDAVGMCCSGLMAGLATSFGLYASIPIAVSLASATLVASGKIGNVTLNKGVPMAALTACAALSTLVGIANGKWLAAFSNGFSVNGEWLLTKFYHDEYRKMRQAHRPPGQALRCIFYRKERDE